MIHVNSVARRLNNNKNRMLKLSRFAFRTRYQATSLYHKTTVIQHPRGVLKSTTLDTTAQQVQIETIIKFEKSTKQEISVSSIPADQELQHSIDSVIKQVPEDQNQYNKQINDLIRSFTNEFQFYYLLDKHSKQFSDVNFLVFISSLRKLKTSSQDLSQIEFQPKIQQLIDKQFIKHGPHYTATNCYFFLLDLNRLNQNLNNKSVQVTLQLLKYHVNKLDLGKLINLKTLLNEMKARYAKKEKPAEFIDSLVKNLETAILFGVQLKQNELEDLYRVSFATDILYNFTNDLSQHQYDQILSYVNSMWKHLKCVDVLNLLESLAKRNVKHILLLNRVCGFFSNFTESFELTSKIYENKDDFLSEFICYRILKAFNKLNFYDKIMYELAIDNILSVISSKKYIDEGLDKKSSHVKIVNCLFDTCIKANVHYNMKIIEYFFDNYLNTDSADKLTIENKSFNIPNILYYSALCRFKNLNKPEIESCVGKINKVDLNNESLIKLMKSLVIYELPDLANSFKSQIDTQGYMSYLDKQFLKNVFQFDTITPTDELNKMKMRTRTMVENALEILYMNHQLYQVEVFDSYFTFAVVTNKKTKQRCHLMMLYSIDRLKNSRELNGEIVYKYEKLKKSIAITDFIWIVDMSELKGVKLNEISDYLEKNIEEIFTRQFSNSVLNKIKL